VLDIDDLDIALSPRDRKAGLADLSRPKSALFVSVLSRATGAADAVTVCCRALRERFGGTVVPQPADTDLFDPAGRTATVRGGSSGSTVRPCCSRASRVRTRASRRWPTPSRASRGSPRRHLPARGPRRAALDPLADRQCRDRPVHVRAGAVRRRRRGRDPAARRRGGPPPDDDAALGPPELDIGNLLAHLDLRALREGNGSAEAATPLLEGYAASSAVLNPLLLDRCRRLSLLRLAGIHREPRLVTLAASRGPGTRT
jgi:hypothetical protein